MEGIENSGSYALSFRRTTEGTGFQAMGQVLTVRRFLTSSEARSTAEVLNNVLTQWPKGNGPIRAENRLGLIFEARNDMEWLDY